MPVEEVSDMEKLQLVLVTKLELPGGVMGFKPVVFALL